jgi:hypothetical protein
MENKMYTISKQPYLSCNHEIKRTTVIGGTQSLFNCTFFVSSTDYNYLKSNSPSASFSSTNID